MSDEPEPVEEIWTFGGTRLGRGDKKVHEWYPPPSPDGTQSESRWYAAKGSYVVGSTYVARVTRHEDGRITIYGEPKYHGRPDDEGFRAVLEAKHRAAETQLRVIAMERADKRDSALEEALRPLLAIAKQLRPLERDAFLAFLIRRITGGW